MKKNKYTRKVGYGIAGLTIGLVVYLLLQSKVPLSIDARSTLVEFANEQNSSEYVLDDEDYNGLIKEPFLEYGSYHISASEYDKYEDRKVVEYGKSNPTFFLKKETSNEKEEIEEEKKNNEDKDVDREKKAENTEKEKIVEKKDEASSSDKSTKDYKEKESETITLSPSDSDTTENNNSDGTGGNSLEGLNIKTKQLEHADADDISHIKSQFAKYAVLPVDKEYYSISSEFGARVDPFEEVKAYHVGLDIASPDIEGANIYSVLDGEVVEKGTGNKGLGNYIVIQHDGFETLYAHMISPTHLDVNEHVKAGDLLGYVGSTGRSTGPHLHFEVGIGSLKLNPKMFVNEIGRND